MTDDRRMLARPAHLTDLAAGFTWSVPARFNIGRAVCDDWVAADPDRIALISEDAGGTAVPLSYAALKDGADRVAHVLAAGGLRPGDRVGILLPQMPQTAQAHIAVYRSGLIAVPLFVLFGPEALAFRLADAGCRAVITTIADAAKLAAIELPALERIYTVDGSAPGTIDLEREAARQATAFAAVDTGADDPALIIYTSGTTGPPKGALHAHRVLLGHLPGVEMSHDFLPQPCDRLWTPADWAWIGGLLDVLLPGLYHGVPVVCRRFTKFSPEAAFDLIDRRGIRNLFLPATALKQMRGIGARRSLDVRTVASGGEPLGTALLDWGREVFGLTINEFYGQTECNMVVANCAVLEAGPPGSMGRPAPGHEVAIIDRDGTQLPPGETGLIAIRRPDPVMFLRYWNNPGATADKFVGDWLITGDTGFMAPDGFLHFVGRLDDVITSAGYRIGPGEIEDCLLGHPAVTMAGVVGKPDPERTEIIKAYIVLAAGMDGNDALRREIRDWVCARLAAHEYPREIEFVDAMPLTATGKIVRRTLRAWARGGGERDG